MLHWIIKALAHTTVYRCMLFLDLKWKLLISPRTRASIRIPNYPTWCWFWKIVKMKASRLILSAHSGGSSEEDREIAHEKCRDLIILAGETATKFLSQSRLSPNMLARSTRNSVIKWLKYPCKAEQNKEWNTCGILNSYFYNEFPF